MREPVGLIGLGLVGAVLAERLVAAGFEVVGYDIDASRYLALGSLPIHRAESPQNVAHRAKRIVLSLPDSDVVEHVVEGPHGIVRSASNETVIVDTTTTDPTRSAQLAERLRTQGIGFVDATISGSSRQIRDGHGMIMAGGDTPVVNRQLDILHAIAPKVFHVGPSGKGAETKLLVNLVLGLNRLALAEGLALGIRAGLEGEVLLTILKSSAAYSQVMETKGPLMLSGKATPEARLRQHLKDVRLILDLGKRLDARVPVSSLHADLLQEATQAGLGDLDNSAIIRIFLDRPSQ